MSKLFVCGLRTSSSTVNSTGPTDLVLWSLQMLKIPQIYLDFSSFLVFAHALLKLRKVLQAWSSFETQYLFQ